MTKKQEAKNVAENKLPEEVTEKYTLKTIRAGKYNFQGFGEIDLRKLTLKKADELVAEKFPFLILKKKYKEENKEEKYNKEGPEGK